MALDLYETIRINRKLVIRSAFLVLLFLVRKLFGPVFLTFIPSHISSDMRHYRSPALLFPDG